MYNWVNVKILFLCQSNSVSSQMAEGLAKSLFGPEYFIQSAGLFSKIVDPLAVEVMREINVDLSAAQSKSLREIKPSSVEVVIFLCEKVDLPQEYSHVTTVRWSLPEMGLNHTNGKTKGYYREIRDQMQRRLEDFLLNY